MSTNSRNEWNALNYTPPFCSHLMREAEKAGAWTTGISSRRQRGTAINCDLYGYDEALGLCVVQLRQAQFQDYFLIGHNEDGSFFSHPVDSPARSPRALESPEACVQWVLSKIWDCRFEDVGDVERQGDIGLVPVSRLPLNAEKVEGSIILQDSHKLSGDIWLAGWRHLLHKEGVAVDSRQGGACSGEGQGRVLPGPARGTGKRMGIHSAGDRRLT